MIFLPQTTRIVSHGRHGRMINIFFDKTEEYQTFLYQIKAIVGPLISNLKGSMIFYVSKFYVIGKVN